MKIIIRLATLTAMAFLIETMFAHAQVPTPIQPPGYVTPAPAAATGNVFLDTIASTFGWNVATMTKWMSLLYLFGIAMKTFMGRFQKWWSDKIAWQVDNKNSSLDRWYNSFLGSKLYIAFSGLLDMVFSLNLPTLESYRKQMDEQLTPTQTGIVVVPAPVPVPDPVPGTTSTAAAPPGVLVPTPPPASPATPAAASTIQTGRQQLGIK